MSAPRPDRPVTLRFATCTVTVPASSIMLLSDGHDGDNDVWADYLAVSGVRGYQRFADRQAYLDALRQWYEATYGGKDAKVEDKKGEGPPACALHADGEPEHHIPERRLDIMQPHIGEDQRPYYYLYRPGEKAGRSRGVDYLQQNGTWGPWGSQVRTWTDKGEAELRLQQLTAREELRQLVATECPTHPTRCYPQIPEFILGMPPYGHRLYWLYWMGDTWAREGTSAWRFQSAEGAELVMESFDFKRATATAILGTNADGRPRVIAL